MEEASSSTSLVKTSNNDTESTLKAADGEGGLKDVASNTDNIAKDKVEVAAYQVEEPEIGRTFKGIDDMFVYYTDYAKQKGFHVLRRTSKKGDDGEVRYVTFICARGGKLSSKPSNRLKRRPSTKTDCKARLGGCLDADGAWRISSFTLEHNHGLNPSDVRYFRRKALSGTGKRQIEIDDGALIGPNRNLNSFVVDAGVKESMLLEKDFRDYAGKLRRLQLGEGDAMALQNYFLKMQTENSNFFYSMDFDEEGRLKNVFWADSMNRAAYKEFGKVITFDTTSLAKKHDMPLTPFVGVNHHGHSILFGCGLISYEDAETFSWLFRTWLACMSDCPPQGIITDQDPAIKRAVEIVFPNARHRWCLWHILKKIPEKLRGLKHYEHISFSLQGVICDSQTQAEFEEKWMMMIQQYSLDENEWLASLYNDRHGWVPCFVKESFWAGMSITQRGESMNSFFDGHVNSKTTIKQFMEQYNLVLASKVEKESQEDYKSSFKQVPCVTTYVEMEKQAQDIYTISKFKEFQLELTGKMYCDFLSSTEDGSFTLCDLQEDIVVGGGKKRVVFRVAFNKDQREVKCSCKKFEFKGILCRHALTVLLRNDVLRIPEKYILRLWRKDIRRCHTRVKICYNWRNSTVEHSRFDKMCSAFAELADLAAEDEENCNYVMNLLWNLKKELPKKDHMVRSDINCTPEDGQKKKRKHVLTQGSEKLTDIDDQTLDREVGIDPIQMISFSEVGSGSHLSNAATYAPHPSTQAVERPWDKIYERPNVGSSASNEGDNGMS